MKQNLYYENSMNLAAPFILSVIYAVSFNENVKKIISVSILGTDIICTAISMRSAYLWLEEIGDTGVKYHLSGFASIVNCVEIVFFMSFIFPAP